MSFPEAYESYYWDWCFPALDRQRLGPVGETQQVYLGQVSIGFLPTSVVPALTLAK
jgi:hypothetical protein